MLTVPHTIVSADATVTHTTFKMTPVKAQTLHTSPSSKTDAFLRVKMPSKGFYKSWRRFGAWNLNDEDDGSGNIVPHSLLFAWAYTRGTTSHTRAYAFGDTPDEAHVEAYDDLLLLRVRAAATVGDEGDDVCLSRVLPLSDAQVDDWLACVVPFASAETGDVPMHDVDDDDDIDEDDDDEDANDVADDDEDIDDAQVPNVSSTAVTSSSATSLPPPPPPPPPTTNDDDNADNDDGEAAVPFFDEDDEDDGGAVDTIEEDDDVQPNDDDDDDEDDTYDDDICAPDALGFEDYVYAGEGDQPQQIVSCGLDTASLSWTSYRPYLGKMSSSFTSTTNKRKAAKKKGKKKKGGKTPAKGNKATTDSADGRTGVCLRGEPLRQRVREALHTVYQHATTLGLCPADDSAPTAMHVWANNVERGIYNSVVQKAIALNVLRKWDNDRFVDVYYQRVKTVTSNLDPRSYIHRDGDDLTGNTRLLARTLPSGDLRPHEVAFLSPAQMQPARWAQLQDAHARKQKEFVPTDFVTLYRCAKCGERKTTVCEVQTRSADEAMTLFITCFCCKHRWRK